MSIKEECGNYEEEQKSYHDEIPSEFGASYYYICTGVLVHLKIFASKWAGGRKFCSICENNRESTDYS